MRVSVIVPTYNEADNVVEVIDRLRRALGGQSHEIIVVDDDSPDGTWQRARRRGAGDPCVRVIRRIGRRGLASAVLDGMAAAEGDALAVIDGDLQHDESVLPEMVRSVLDDGADVCVGTRRGESGSFGDRARPRQWITAAGAALARRVLPVLRRSSDPLSGFFVVSRRTCERAAPAINRNLREYKILWAFLARDRSLTVAEVGYEFRPRAGGRTKLSGPVLLDDLVNAPALRLGPAVSPLFVKYCLVGVTGRGREPRRLRPRGARRPAHREPGHHPRPQPDLPVSPAGDPGRHTILRRDRTNRVRRPDTSRSRTFLSRRSCTLWQRNPHCGQRSLRNVDSTLTLSAPGVSSITSSTRICGKCSRTAVTSPAIGALLDR